MITMLHADCMAYMAALPDKAFDLAIVDPPYMDKWKQIFAPGAAISTTGIKRNRQEFKHWDVPGNEYFSELFRISQHQIIWGCNYYESFIPFSGRLIWDKLNDSSTFSKAEIAASDLLYGIQMFRFEWNGMLQGDMANKENRIHPTQKPVALYKWLMTRYAKPGWKIIDTHGGSGSIAIACHDLGFDLTWMELDADYYAAAVKRYEEHARQAFLFDPTDKTPDPVQAELL